MASQSLHRQGLRVVSRLHQQPRTQLVRIRGFHASLSRSSVLETCCSQTFEVMSTLHSSTGLSWVYILPVTAVLLRSIIVLPLSIWSRTQLRKLREVQPLLLAWMPKIARDVMKRNRGASPATCEQIIKREHKKKVTEIRKDFGITLWSAYASLLQLPFFLVVMETVRQMCSTRLGLFTWIGQYIPWLNMETRIPVQSDLATEGALWFQDLLLPDPYYVLPIAVSGILYRTVVYEDRLRRRLSSTAQPEKSKLTMVLKGFSIGILFFTTQFPAAMMVYWASSSAFALASSYALQRLMPIAPGIIPCRPLTKSYLLPLNGQQQNQPQTAFARWRAANL